MKGILLTKITVLVFWVSVFVAHAQNETFSPSPNASGLASFSDYPVDLHNGVLAVNVPIYEHRDVDVSVPIALRYHGSGIKVDDIASWVGAGWNLQAGGVITRVVKGGIPDDFFKSTTNASSGYLNWHVGWLDYLNTPAAGLDTFPHGYSPTDPEYDSVSAVACSSFDTENYTYNTVLHDSEPDVFYLNLNGRSVKFLFDTDWNIHFLGYEDIQITYEKDSVEDSGELIGRYYQKITSFTVTTEDGTQYFFETTEETTVEVDDDFDYSVTDGPIFFQKSLDMTFTSAWYLSKIITPKARKIEFNYTENTISYQEEPIYRRVACTPQGNCVSVEKSSPDKDITVKTQLLTSIVGPLTSIHLNAYTVRKDLTGGLALDEIAIVNTNTGDLIKSFALEYDQVLSQAGGCSSSDVKCNRLFLTSIQELDKYKCMSQSPYRFIYNDTILPERGSFQQDHWGFYNGRDNNSLIPELYLYPGVSDPSEILRAYEVSGTINPNYYLPGADRSIDEGYLMAGMLEKVNYPTGGYAEFTYESNEYYDEYGELNIKGGGIRIKKVNYSSGDGNDIIKRYSYRQKTDTSKSSGFLIHKLGYTRMMATSEWTGGDLFHSCDHAPPNDNTFNIYNHYTQRISTSFAPLSNMDGVHVAYTEVRVDYGSEQGSDSRGFSEFKYYVPRNFRFDAPTVRTTGLLGYDYTKTITCKWNPCWGMNIEFDCDVSNSTTQTKCSVTGYDIYGPIDLTGENIYPYPPLTDENAFSYQYGLRPYGKILSQSDYDVDSNLVKKTEYEYDTYIKGDSLQPTTIYGLTLQRHIVDIDEATVCYYAPRAWARYEYKVDAVTYVKRIIEKNYDRRLNDRYLETIRDFFYDYTDHFLLSKTVTANSDSTQSIANYYYPFNYSYQGGQKSEELLALEAMVDNNMISAPVEVQSWIKKKGGTAKMINGSLSTYKRTYTNHYTDSAYFVPLVAKTYEWQSVQPVASPDTSAIDTLGNFIFDSLYVLATSYDLYDSIVGNPIQVTGEDGVPTSRIYGHDRLVPLATIKGGRVTTDYLGNSASYVGFEDGVMDSEGPKVNYWKLYNGAVGWSFSSDAHTGNYSFYVPAIGSSLDFFKREFKPEIQEGKFLLSAWVKTESGYGTNKGEFVIHTKSDTDANDTLAPASCSTPLTKTMYFSDTQGEWVYLQTIIDFSKIRRCADNDLRIKCVWRNQDASKGFYIDDIRFHPVVARMNTQTFDPGVGITSQSGNSSKPVYVEFDDFNRKKLLKDFKGDIVERTTYGLNERPYYSAVFSDSLIDDYEVRFDVPFYCNGANLTFEWDFDHGSVQSTTASYITYQYPSSTANYDVTLSVYDEDMNLVAGPWTKEITAEPDN